jgi:iron complex outermembrane receptor protein
MSKISLRHMLALTASGAAILSAANAYAANDTSSGTEGVDANAVIVTAERSKAAEAAPSKASLIETQPESIISRKFIDQSVSETGSWVSVSSIAPSVSGIAANGGGVGETSKLTLRGFQDGQFNITYDGIAFGDTNGPTHHQASYFPASTIGAVVVDRGPGAAGDLGQANFGGAIHFFSEEVSDHPSISQKLTYGSFNTESAVTTLNTGTLSQLGGGKLLVNLDFRKSDGELSYSGGSADNLTVKYVLPVNDKSTFILFSSINQTRFYQSDAGPGETYAQVLAFGKNYALNNTPGDEHYFGYNYQYKATDFDYADLKTELFPSFTAEDQLYTYYYSNKTSSTNSITDIGSNASSLITEKTVSGTQKLTDLGGYDKLNLYRVWGDIVRLNKDWSFGTLKVGGQVESAITDRHNGLLDFTNGDTPDNAFKVGTPPVAWNYGTMENSDYLTWQVFGDFEWRPIENLKISPGFKYIHSKIDVNAADDKINTVITAGNQPTTANEPFVASNTYSSPLYFITANYMLRPDWSVYGQVATSFLLPGLGNLYYTGANVQSLQPEKTITYQTGTVFSHGSFTADADVYRIDATNIQTNCNDPGNSEPALCNAGSGRYSGVEGEAAYALPFGLTVFGNGALISAKQLANAANVLQGLSGNPAEQLPNAPKWTDSFGVVLNHNQWLGSLTYKQSGAYSVYSTKVNLQTNPALPVLNPRFNFDGYSTFDASAGYDFGNFKIKLQGFNLLDSRAITNFSPTKHTTNATAFTASDLSLIEYQAGRELSLTLQAKF